MQVLLVSKESKVSKEVLASLDWVVNLALLDQKVRKGSLDCRDSLVHRVLQASRDHQAKLVALVLLVLQVCQDFKVRLVLQDQRVQQVKLENVETPEYLDSLDRLDHQASRMCLMYQSVMSNRILMCAGDR